MANIPLNLFRNITQTLGIYTPNVIIYTAPTSRATIILNAQAANTTASFQTVTLAISSKSNNTQAYLLSGFSIPPNDTANLILGKIVLIEGDRLLAWAGSNNSVDLFISILETINTETII
jgi:hypothetical protein